MASTGKRRDKAQVARDRRRIADLYLQGWVQADIAEELEISQATVSRDIKALQDEWQQSSLVDIDKAKAQELAKVDRLEREYWRAWERSCEDKEATLVENREAKGDKQSKSWMRREGQAGDPRFLTGVQWCIERRCKILGIDAPTKFDAWNLNIDLSQCTNEQLQRIANGEDPRAVLATSGGSGAGAAEAGGD